MIDNLPVFYVSLATNNKSWEFNFLRAQFLVVKRADNGYFLIQFDQNQDNNPFQDLLIILKAFKNSRCFVEHKGKTMVFNYITGHYMELAA